MPRITASRPADAAEWDAAYAACPSATWFQSRPWAEVWRDYTEGASQPAPSRVEFSDGVTALLPLSRESAAHGLLPRYLLSPAGTFGGWLAEDELPDAHAEVLREHLLTRHGTLAWRVNPYDGALRRLSWDAYDHDETHAVDLRQGFDAVESRFSRGQRSNLRKALKAGVEVRVAESRADWHEYFQVYEESLDRWGDSASSGYGWSLFEALYELRSPDVRLWLAHREGELAAGALCFYTDTQAVYWHGAARERHFAMRPVNLLMVEAMRDAAARHCAWFDFNPSGGHEGVKTFKRSFGAEPVASPEIHSTNWSAAAVGVPVRAVRKTRRALARRTGSTPV
jgi:CelD/BcsL family acetyltransferase involved in cellulose biosynthesis